VRPYIEKAAIRTFTLRERIESGVSWNPVADSYHHDPYPNYRALREKDPIHRSRLFDGWVVTRHADIAELLRDTRLSADDRNLRRYEQNRQRLIEEGIMGPDERDNPTLLRLDPPDHTRLRTLVSKAFTPRAVESLRPRIEELVDELVGSLEGEADIISGLAVPLPVLVIAEMLGIPGEDRLRFRTWSDSIAKTLGLSTFDDIREAREAQKELNEYLEPIAEERRREPREDLLSALVRAEEQGDRLSRSEVFETVSLLLVAGNETTTNLIGNALLALIRNPGEYQKLRGDPSLLPGAVEEFLRYDSPVQLTSRIVREDFEFRGKLFRKGQEIDVLLGAGNRDPEMFVDPERLDVTRTEVRHLSFSQGIHYCLGAPLARMEGAIAFAALARRFSRIEMNGKALRGRNIVLRGVKRLPVKLSCERSAASG
jgi:cytochrome P450